MNTAAFLEGLHRCLDERRDPLDDADLVAFLDAHPEQLATFAAMRGDLRLLETAPRARERHRWPWLAAACIAAAAGGFACLHGIALNTTGSGPRILDATIEELRPRTHIAVHFTVRQSLLHTETTSLETWLYRSEPR